MNKKGQTSGEVLEWIKIVIILVVGWIIIKALINLEMNDSEIKCICSCIKNGVIYLN